MYPANSSRFVWNLLNSRKLTIKSVACVNNGKRPASLENLRNSKTENKFELSWDHCISWKLFWNIFGFGGSYTCFDRFCLVRRNTVDLLECHVSTKFTSHLKVYIYSQAIIQLGGKRGLWTLLFFYVARMLTAWRLAGSVTRSYLLQPGILDLFGAFLKVALAGKTERERERKENRKRLMREKANHQGALCTPHTSTWGREKERERKKGRNRENHQAALWVRRERESVCECEPPRTFQRLNVAQLGVSWRQKEQGTRERWR